MIRKSESGITYKKLSPSRLYCHYVFILLPAGKMEGGNHVTCANSWKDHCLVGGSITLCRYKEIWMKGPYVQINVFLRTFCFSLFFLLFFFYWLFFFYMISRLRYFVCNPVPPRCQTWPIIEHMGQWYGDGDVENSLPQCCRRCTI